MQDEIIDARVVDERVDAIRVVARGHIVHSAVCPFCQIEAVDADGTAMGCAHVLPIEHGSTGSYFTFERPA